MPNSAKGIASGAVAGLVALPVGPLVGAYIGALAGGVSNTSGHESFFDPERRPAAVMVAVAVPDPRRDAVAAQSLQDAGARNIERAEGEICNGKWVDFDPVAKPRLVHPRSTRPAITGARE